MDCVSSKSNKKAKGVRAPRARGKRASFQACSAIEEPTSLDPKNSDSVTQIPTELGLDDSDAKSEKENETVILPADGTSTGVQFPHIGESSTDDFLHVEDNNEKHDPDNDGSIESVEVKESSESSVASPEDLEKIEEPYKSENDSIVKPSEAIKDSENDQIGKPSESENSLNKDRCSETDQTVENMAHYERMSDEMNQDSDGEIHFVARPRPEDEYTSDKDEADGTSEEKCKVENDVSIAVQSNHEITYPVFSEYVDHSSVGEDVKDESSDSGEIEAGKDVLVQYMQRHQYKQLKATLRNGAWGLTSDVRCTLWYNMCHYLHKADDADMFSEFAEDLFAPGDYSDIGMPSFVDMQHLNSYHLSTEGISTAKQIVCVLGHSCPDIIYSPVLFSILSIFLHYMDRSQCYNCLYSLLRHKDSTFLPTTKVSYEASKLVMRDLAKKYAKSGYVHLVRNCSNIDQMFDSWIWWIFEDLPMIFLVRVMDCYLQEGIKIFYRVSIAILILFSKINTKKSSPKNGSPGSNVLTSLRQFCREIPVPVHKLLKTCFGIKGLSRKEIRKLQVKHEMFITSHKNVNSYENQTGNRLTLSKSFSGPMILQNLGSDTLTVDMLDPEDRCKSRSVGMLQVQPLFKNTTILDKKSLYALLTWLPTRYAICQPELLYTSEEHGTSLVTLYQRVENHQPTVIIIKTTEDEVFGAFCSTYWYGRRQKSQLLSYFGTGETFIFTLSPEKKKYDWVGLREENIPNTASMFQAGDRSILTIGGGHGEAIYLDETMLHCRSTRCDTFDNEPLSQSEDFVCKVVEVYGFQ